MLPFSHDSFGFPYSFRSNCCFIFTIRMWVSSVLLYSLDQNYRICLTRFSFRWTCFIFCLPSWDSPNGCVVRVLKNLSSLVFYRFFEGFCGFIAKSVGPTVLSPNLSISHQHSFRNRGFLSHFRSVFCLHPTSPLLQTFSFVGVVDKPVDVNHLSVLDSKSRNYFRWVELQSKSTTKSFRLTTYQQTHTYISIKQRKDKYWWRYGFSMALMPVGYEITMSKQ